MSIRKYLTVEGKQKTICSEILLTVMVFCDFNLRKHYLKSKHTSCGIQINRRKETDKKLNFSVAL